MKNTITLRHACVAYLAAVTAAAICGASPALVAAPISRSMPTLGLAWLAAFVGLLPLTWAIYRANKRGIRSWAYFAVFGAMAALASAALLIGVEALACEEEDSASNLLGMLLFLEASGAAGGTACWFALRVQARLDTRVRMS
jgi:hypothetical protein